jgi:predicted permease
MPDWRPALRARLTHARLSPAHEASIADELAQHLDDRWHELVGAGVDPERAAALVNDELERSDLLAARLGALRRGRERPSPAPGVRAGGPLAGFRQDARYAWRSLRRDPVVSLVAILTLAFGIGLNTSMFGFMNALIFRPLPFADAGSLFRMFRATPENSHGPFSLSEYQFVRQADPAVARFAAYRPAALALSDGAGSIAWFRVSANLFDVLGAQPVLGRSFRPDDERRGHGRPLLISAAVWQERYGGSPEAVGQIFEAGGERFEIVGVLPPAAGDHRLFGRASVFSPLLVDDPALDPQSRTLTILGRRGASVSAAQADAFVAALGARAAADHGAGSDTAAWRVEGLPTSNAGPTGRAILAMLLGLSLLVLLIACSNLANVLLARAIDRSREFALRAALGASRAQIVRAVTLESVLLAGAGLAGALLIAVWTSRWLQSLAVDGGGPAVPVDGRVVAFAAAAAIGTVFLCAAAPVLFTRRIGTSDTLRSGGRGLTASRGHVRLRGVFIATQFALAMVLLAAATFFAKGVRQMMSEEYGWRADRVVQGEIELPRERYADAESITDFQRRAAERLARIPGAAAASVSYGLPYKGLRGAAPYIGDADETGRPVTARINGASPSYFDVTGTPVVAGRSFAATDTASSPPVAIVSASMARRLFGGSHAVGRRVALADGAGRGPWMEIVGVAADVRSIDFAQEPAPFQLYQPTTQDPRRGLVIAVRAGSARPEPLVAAIPSAIAELDPALVARGVDTAVNRMQDVTASMSLVMQLLGGFALLGLLLSALGIYGSMARMVAQRTNEIGIRIAMGARTRHALGLVFGAAARILLPGIGLGLAGAFGLSRVLASVLPGMTIAAGFDSVAAALVLAAAGLTACWLPARRAASVEPMVALRAE